MANKWIEHVKREARKLGIPYAQAVGDRRVKASYTPRPSASGMKRKRKARR